MYLVSLVIFLQYDLELKDMYPLIKKITLIARIHLSIILILSFIIKYLVNTNEYVYPIK